MNLKNLRASCYSNKNCDIRVEISFQYGNPTVVFIVDGVKYTTNSVELRYE
jgi:hypothetical protein